MATKWKNFTRNCWVKAVAFVLILASTGVIVWQTVAFASFLSKEQGDQFYPLFDGRMLFTHDIPIEYLMDRQSSALNNLYSYVCNGDETYVSSGQSVSDADIVLNLYWIFQDTYYDSDVPVYPAEEGSADALTDEKISELISLGVREAYEWDDISSFRTWLQNNRGAYAAVRDQLITDKLDATRAAWNESLMEDYDYYGYCKNTNTTKTNLNVADAADVEQQMASSDYPLVLSLNQSGSFSWSGMLPYKTAQYNYGPIDWFGTSPSSFDDVVFIALKPEAYDSLNTQWTTTSLNMQHTAGVIGAAALVALIGFILLCFGAGRKPVDDDVHLSRFDRVWTELQLAAGIFVCFLWIGLTNILINDYLSAPQMALYAVGGLSSLLLVACLLTLMLSQIRRIKARKWLDGFILWRLFKKYVVSGGRWLARQFNKTPLRQKLILLAILLPLACAFWVTIPFVIAGLLFFGLRIADSFERITDGAHAIRTGKTDTHITVTHGGKELHALADDLNGISDGFGDAVNTAVKSERLKAELISNVSHDIKTPLTSIITYVDLLKKCNLTDPTAREYVDILDQKTQRLRILTGDLFDASKASSGAMKVESRKTDFDALVRQALGERSKHLEQANLDVRIDSTPPVYVNADGRLLWRILDNLLSNCARYALPGSRVYITIQPGTEFATLTIKNISASELNISSDELMERFTRGDRSRHTEGSGLGLSIAKSLAELMGGTCRVEIDGDLFKSIVTIPTWTEP